MSVSSLSRSISSNSLCSSSSAPVVLGSMLSSRPESLPGYSSIRAHSSVSEDLPVGFVAPPFLFPPGAFSAVECMSLGRKSRGIFADYVPLGLRQRSWIINGRAAEMCAVARSVFCLSYFLFLLPLGTSNPNENSIKERISSAALGVLIKLTFTMFSVLLFVPPITILNDFGKPFNGVAEMMTPCSEKVIRLLDRGVDVWVRNAEQQQLVNLRCPLTTRYFTFPVTTSCNHTFEYSSLFRYVQKVRMLGCRLFPFPCPHCSRLLKATELKVGQKEIEVMQPIREQFFAHLEGIFQDWDSLRRQKGSTSLDLSQDKDVKSLDLKNFQQGISQFLKLSDEKLYELLWSRRFTELGFQIVCYMIASRMPCVEQKVKQSVADITHLLAKEDRKGLLSLEERVHLLGNIVTWKRQFKAIPDSCPRLKRLSIA